MMNIELSEVQKNKILTLNQRKEEVSNELARLDDHINDVLDIILDFNGVEKDEIEKLELLESGLVVTKKSD